MSSTKSDKSSEPDAGPRQAEESRDAAKPPAQQNRLRQPWVLAVIGVVLTVAFYLGLTCLLNAFVHESTDDAFLESDIVAVAPKVAGQVATVHVRENQSVKQGELLVEIDPQDYAMKVAQKRASAQTTEANYKTLLSVFELMRAKVTTAEASARQAKAESEADAASTERARSAFKRNQELRQQGTISPQEFDDAQMAARWAEANLNAAEQKAAQESSKVDEAKAQLAAAETAVSMALAQFNQSQTDVQAAELDLSYAKILAPCNGSVTRKTVEPGNYVQVGQSLLALVTTDLWVVANFKETQLTDMRPSQPAEIRIDAYPARRYRGHVDSIMAGSGARFSLLPPENAVGNFVKVVQRVPVKILFDEPLDPAMSLGPGMSVVPQVRTHGFVLASVVLWLVAIVLAAVATLGIRRMVEHLQA